MVRQWAGVTNSRIPICVVRLSLSKPYHLDRRIYVGAAWLASQGIEMSDMARDGKPLTRLSPI